MATIEQRYLAAVAYVRRAIERVERQNLSVIPALSAIEWYAGRTKTESSRNELERIEARWLRAANDIDRARIAREAELLADRVQENLPGAPQDRTRTNLTKGEVATSTPATSYLGEAERHVADSASAFIFEATHAVAAASEQLEKLSSTLVVAGALFLGWKWFKSSSPHRTRDEDDDAA